MNRPLPEYRLAKIAGLLILLSPGLTPADDKPAIIEQQLSQAAMLAGACFNCHGTDGKQHTNAMPAIAGVSKDILEAQMLAFRQGTPTDATVMDRIAQGFSEAEIKLLAEYFSRQSAPERSTGEDQP